MTQPVMAQQYPSRTTHEYASIDCNVAHFGTPIPTNPVATINQSYARTKPNRCHDGRNMQSKQISHRAVTSVCMAKDGATWAYRSEGNWATTGPCRVATAHVTTMFQPTGRAGVELHRSQRPKVEQETRSTAGPFQGRGRFQQNPGGVVLMVFPPEHAVPALRLRAVMSRHGDVRPVVKPIHLRRQLRPLHTR